MTNHVLFVGAGNMGSAIIKSYLKTSGTSDVIHVIDPFVSDNTKDLLSECKFYESFNDLQDSIEFDTVVLAIKPQSFDEISRDLSNFITEKSIVISIMAGVETKRISNSLNKNAAVIRCMPNIAALVNRSVNVAYIAKDSKQSHKKRFENIFLSSGPIRWVNNEDLIHKTTALSGSGPAYFFLFIEALAKAGQSAGLSEEQAMDLSIDTLIGAAALIEQDRSPEKLRESVTSKGGTTAAALSVFKNNNNLDELVSEALLAAEKKSREL